MFEKDVVEKCEKEPKLFYRYINGKMTSKETIDKLTKEGRKGISNSRRDE